MKKLLILAYIFVVAHTIKDFFQDFLETDFLYFADANENLFILPQWGRWLLVSANYLATTIGFLLVILTPLIFVKSRPRLAKWFVAGYVFFFVTLGIDLLLDPRITNPKLFFDKSTRISASKTKASYEQILFEGPF